MLTKRDLDEMFADPALVEEAFWVLQKIVLDTGATSAAATLTLAVRSGTFTVELRDVVGGEHDVTLRVRPAGGARATDAAEMLVNNDGAPIGFASGDALDAWRAAVPVGLAARYLAPAGARSLGLYGVGAHARVWLWVLTVALPSLSIVRIYGADRSAAREIAAGCRESLVVTVEEEPWPVTTSDVVAVFDEVRSFESRWVADETLLFCPEGVPTGLDCVRVVAASGAEPGPPAVALADILRGEAVARCHGVELVVYQTGDVPLWDSAFYSWVVRRARQLDRGKLVAFG
ncbi:hypothetical protein ACFWY9_03890 [Amycolatopsis sp. NPDC059027]|uniref:hypothetical protein n=1 Tax=Amycolatopsis sp. NPDC059027 TaxID=3346709 RepID=UPI00366A8748